MGFYVTFAGWMWGTLARKLSVADVPASDPGPMKLYPQSADGVLYDIFAPVAVTVPASDMSDEKLKFGAGNTTRSCRLIR